MDVNYSYPFEDIRHLLTTNNYSGSTMPRNEIVSRNIFKRGQPATREAIQAGRTYAIHKIHKRLGVAIQLNPIKDLIVIVIKKQRYLEEWLLTWDMRVRFPNKRLAITACD